MRTIATTIILALVACGPAAKRNNGDDTDANTGGDGPIGPVVDAARCEKIDVLFVIDNSGSMGGEQTNLIQNFPQFISVLDASGLDYRVAVTTTSRKYTYKMTTIPGLPPITQSTEDGANGAMLQPAPCNMTRRWLEKGDADVSGTFSCLANVGTTGSSDEMPLGAMRDAFEDRMADGTNMGFHRADALLGIVFLTDEEDCSYEQTVTFSFGQALCLSQMEPAANYVQFLDTFAGNRSRWAIAAIAGPGPGQCSSTFGSADEATRLKAFVQQTGTNATMSSICDGDLSIGLSKALMLFESACGGIIL